MVVPFRGERAALQELRRRLERLELTQGDSLLVVDNTPGAGRAAAAPARVPVLHASRRATPGFARNQGAARGNAPWIAFMDSDTTPSPDLLDRFFEPAPGDRTGVLAGGVLDEPVSPQGHPAARYAYLRGVADQHTTLRFGEWGYPKTSNAVFRRTSFEAVGGFREELRAGEDADLAYRLGAAGWHSELREGATVVHRNRQTVRGFVVQRAVHGAGAAWLERAYPGSFPARRRPGLVWWGLRRLAAGLASAVWQRNRDEAVWAVMEPIDDLAFEFGRSLSNERSLP